MKRTILFIGSDDAESNAAVETTALTETRELIEATYEEADRFLADRFDDIGVVIIDLAPGQIAVNLLEAIAESAANPPVIVLADEGQFGAIPVARRGGASACIRKPLTSEKLTSVMEQLGAAESEEKNWTSDVWGHPHRRLVCTIE